MSDLLQRLKAGRSAIATVELDAQGEPLVFGLRILTEKDYAEAAVAVEAKMREAGIVLDVSTADIFEDAKTTALLFRALIDPHTKLAVAKTIDELSDALPRSDRTYLINQYLLHEAKFAPSTRNLSDSDLKAFIAELKKTPEPAQLNNLSIDTLKKLLLTMAVQPVT